MDSISTSYPALRHSLTGLVADLLERPVPLLELLLDLRVPANSGGGEDSRAIGPPRNQIAVGAGYESPRASGG